MIEQTFAMIKPDAIQSKYTGAIIDLMEKNGFDIMRMQKGILTQDLAQEFYGVHKERPFFQELVFFIISGPVIVMVLEKENAIKAWRELMGATDPKNALDGTVRKMFGASIGHNAVHGSDGEETASFEIGLFFPDLV